MRHFAWLIIIRLCCAAALAAEGDRVVLGDDGSVVGRFSLGPSVGQSMVFRFGLPRIPAAKMWREGEVLRGLWITNGIHYTQTALVSRSAPDTTETNGAAPPAPVLLVSIEGHNTNAEYAEAFAELTLEIRGKRQELELKDGFLWRLEGQTRSLLGALEIPESGVKIARGDVLQFSGNMPPSLKGSMTLRMPLEPLQNEAAAERLKDMEFEGELRRSINAQQAAFKYGQGRMVFAHDERDRATRD